MYLSRQRVLTSICSGEGIRRVVEWPDPLAHTGIDDIHRRRGSVRGPYLAHDCW